MSDYNSFAGAAFGPCLAVQAQEEAIEEGITLSDLSLDPDLINRARRVWNLTPSAFSEVLRVARQKLAQWGEQQHVINDSNEIVPAV